jgi:hypothetical protein
VGSIVAIISTHASTILINFRGFTAHNDQVLEFYATKAL